MALLFATVQLFSLSRSRNWLSSRGSMHVSWCIIATAGADISTAVTSIMTATHQCGNNSNRNERHECTHGSASYLIVCAFPNCKLAARQFVCRRMIHHPPQSIGKCYLRIGQMHGPPFRKHRQSPRSVCQNVSVQPLIIAMMLKYDDCSVCTLLNCLWWSCHARCDP